MDSTGHRFSAGECVLIGIAYSRLDGQLTFSQNRKITVVVPLNHVKLFLDISQLGGNVEKFSIGLQSHEEIMSALN